jgi:hypothetical protein
MGFPLLDTYTRYHFSSAPVYSELSMALRIPNSSNSRGCLLFVRPRLRQNIPVKQRLLYRSPIPQLPQILQDASDRRIQYHSGKQANKQRLLGFWTIPSRRPKKEDQITLSVLDPLPARIRITSLATRLYSNKIVFRPKSTEKFAAAAKKLGITMKEATEL